MTDDDLSQESPESSTQQDSEQHPPAGEDQTTRLSVEALARELDTTSQRVLDALHELDGRPREPDSSVDEDVAARVRAALADGVGAPDVGGVEEPRPADDTTAPVRPPDYMPLFVEPHPVQPIKRVDDDDDDDDHGDDDLEDSGESDEEPSGRQANRRRRRGRRGRGRGRGEQGPDDSEAGSAEGSSDKGDEPDESDDGDEAEEDTGAPEGTSPPRRRRRRRKAGGGGDAHRRRGGRSAEHGRSRARLPQQRQGRKRSR